MNNLMARANSLLIESAKKNIGITPLKLQKLLYLSYGEYIKLYDHELEYLEFEAWTYGPVVPHIYNMLKFYKDNKITDKLIDSNGDIYYLSEDSLDIKNTVSQYAPRPTFELVDITHREGGAWFRTIKESGYNTKIKFEYIQEEFNKPK